MSGLCIGILVAFIALVFISIMIFLDYSRNGDEFLRFIGALCSVLSLLMLPLAIVILVDNFSTYDYCMHNIVSIKRESQAEGSFFLGSGTVEEETYYFYYYEVKPNVYKLGKKPTSRTYIIQDDSVIPCVYKHKEQAKDYYYDIYVPVGTIITTFSLN